MLYLVARDSTSKKLVEAQSLMQLAIKKLETEFYRILSQNRDRFDSESISVRSSTDRRSSSSDEEFSDDDSSLAADSVSMSAVADLKAIAECMIFTGYSKECVNIYLIVRKSIMDEALYNLGVENLSFSQIQKMDWEMVEYKIKCWLNAVKVAVNTLFHGERILCNYIFDSPEKNNIGESCFADICRDSEIGRAHV